jgi:pimeloyl-ACP methyl ester carboxylesterase
MPKIFLLALLVISGCASLPNSTTANFNNHKIEFALTKNGSKTIVFENGLGAQMEWWKDVLPKVSNQITTFTYNRPGYGRSAAATSPRDGSNIVDELREILRAKNLKPPYVLVGHSLGGLYMQLFARRYPHEVNALILVDSTHPRQLEGNGALEKHPLLVKIIFAALLNKTTKEELALLSKTGQDVLNLPVSPNVKVIILSAAKPLKYHSQIADDSNEKRKDILNLYPHAKQIWVESGHAMPLENPDAIAQAIAEVMN